MVAQGELAAHQVAVVLALVVLAADQVLGDKVVDAATAQLSIDHAIYARLVPPAHLL